MAALMLLRSIAFSWLLMLLAPAPATLELNCPPGPFQYSTEAAIDFPYKQVINVYDTIPAPVIITGPDSFCADPAENCGSLVDIAFTVEDSCFNAFPELIDMPLVRVFMDLEDNGTIDYELLDTALVKTVSNYIVHQSVSAGDHRLEIQVEDEWGNAATYDFEFSAGVDCIAPPELVCINGLAAEFLPYDTDGDTILDVYGHYLTATDLLGDLVTDDDTCNAGTITYSLNLFDEEPDMNTDSIFFDCSDLGIFQDETTKVLEVHTWDEAGNSSSCVTYVLFTNVNCGDPAFPAIAGTVFNELMHDVTGVPVYLSGQGIDSIITNEDGYAFWGLTEGYDYTVNPAYSEGYLNGVSTFDILLISQHILGLNPLNSPFKRIAADVNNSGSITTLDLIAIRKLILGLDAEFPNGVPSWRFVDADYIFPDTVNPWEESIPTSISVYDIGWTGVLDADFIAIKMGDVNLDAEVELD